MSKTRMQRRFVDLAQFRFREEGTNGEMEGYVVRYNDINDYGEINLPGAYDESIPEFLASGFSTDNHDWSWSGTVGYPIEAKSDNNGLLIRVAFHSTPDAQNMRVKIRERIDAGKTVGLSEGFIPQDYTVIYPTEYDSKLPQYLRRDRLKELMAYAREFPRIIVIKRASIMEGSFVTAPSQANATVLSVRNAKGDLADPYADATDTGTTGNPVQTRGEFLGERAEGSAAWAAIQQLFDSFTWLILWDACFSSTVSAVEGEQLLAGGFDEMKQIALKIYTALIEDEAGEDDGEATRESSFANTQARRAVADKIAAGMNKFLGSRGSLQLQQHSDVARAAMKGIVSRAADLSAVRKREGKTLSKKTRDTLEQLHGDMQTCCANLRDMLDGVESEDTDSTSESRSTAAPNAPDVSATDRPNNQHKIELRKRDLARRLEAHRN